ncbi:chemotaxis protein CheW [Pseudoduganella chitinolytica]|uniref:Chemotaxis protein CheW n=1 Tax=Pseudoduganella chitinolytica TaxID=34070 RepID=A0ABY8B6Y1_9BURK|nr:chemotaxis protein CheW [Pseudoduganella chitinolytica]WEF31193.1 chemotaxis protein CheW [Pseudoduganella chitinolytica]
MTSDLPDLPPGAEGDDSAPGGAERRSRLRQYQVQLLERMQAAQSEAVATGRELGVLIGARHYLLDLTQVGEIVPHHSVAAVPLTRDWYLGLANIRGNLTGIVDLARFQDEPALQPGAEARFVTFAPALGLPCALLVSRVLGLRKLADMTAAAAEPDGAPAGAHWRAETFTDSDGLAWQRLDLALLVADPRFLHVGR